MATQTAPQTYNNENKNLLRLSCIHQKVLTKVLRYVFQNGSSNRPQHMSLLDYYADKGINATKFRNRLFEEQRKKVDTDFQGDTFDITLLYRCLRCGSHGLAGENEEKWNKADKASIESLITIVKNKRNRIAHEQPMYTNSQLIYEVHELREELLQILKFSRQIYHIPDATIDQEIADVKANIENYLNDDFDQKTFEEYKAQLFFDAQSEFLKDEGVKDTMQQYDSCMEGEVSPTNHLVDLNLAVDDIFTEMTLKGKSQFGQDKAISYEDVLKDDSQKLTGSVIVVSGPAGSGKTTFTKKTIRDFKLDVSIMKYLITHDHLLKAECRDNSIKSFKEFLHHRMPKVSKYFRADDLEKVALAQKLLVILDGLDELNEASAQLFEELLWLKKTFGITLIITTRPEMLESLKMKLRSHNLDIKHIEILGVPPEKRDELVLKYHREIAKKFPGIQDIKGLLSYLKETEHRLAKLWRLPYNLTLVTIIWSFDFMNVTSINTAPELYREILQLYRTRLKERLRSYKSTQHLKESELNEKVEFFLCCLGRESLIGLVNNHINLPQEAYERLVKNCSHIKIPIEEMISAFLRRIPGVNIIYGFPHKGVQDFLAAHYIWLKITGKSHEHVQDALDSFAVSLFQKNLPQIWREEALKVMKDELQDKTMKQGKLASTATGPFRRLFLNLKASSFIQNILSDMHGSTNYDLSKFQNMFICLLGMFYSEKDVIDKDIKLEALMLLQRTGVKDKDSWINILNSVKCDEYVAKFISDQPKILAGNIQITDSSVSAYISLMKALKPPLKNAQKVKVDLDIKGDLNGAQELLQLICSHQFKVKSIMINSENLKDYIAMLKALATPLIDARTVKIDVCDIDELSFRELMNLIEKNQFTIRTLQVRDFEINDANYREYISVFKSLPKLRKMKNVNQTSFDINIKGDLTDSEELLELISSRGFKVKNLLIYESNFMKYAAMMKELTTPLKDAHDVKVNICDVEELLDIRDLLILIKKKHFTVETLQLRDPEINDANVREHISMFKSLPRDLENANQMCVDINITGDLTGNEELLELICRHHFKVKRLLLNENNCMTHLSTLKTLTKPLKYANEVKVDICVDEFNDTIVELMRNINENDFVIGIFQVREFHIHVDSNLPDYISILQKVPLINWQNSNTPSVYVSTEGDLTGTTDLINLISIHQLKVKRILITKENFRNYTELLKNLPKPLKDARDINFEIKVNVTLPEIVELVKHIRNKGFRIRTLELKEKTMIINTDNLSVYTEALESLPTMDRNVYKGDIFIYSEKDTLEFSAILKEIARNQFAIEIKFSHDFRHSTSPSEELEKNLNGVFKSCPIKKYVGRMTPHLILPLGITDLWVRIEDTPSYIQFNNFIGEDLHLECLNIVISLEVEIVSPQPWYLSRPTNLFLPDVQTMDSGRKACEIAKRLQLAVKGFGDIYFPRLRLKEEEIKELLREMVGITTQFSVVLPTSSRPTSKAVEDELNQLAESTLKCNIGWGKNEDANHSSLFVIDSW